MKHVTFLFSIFWGNEKPKEIATKPLHPKKCTCWCALSEHGIIGPYWFEEDGETVTVNSVRYQNKALQPFWNALGRRRGVDRSVQWFQQDGASPHTSLESRLWLEDHFEDRIVSFKTPYIWSPHSPDLNPLDFFLWGYCKDNVYFDKPATIDQLKRNVTRFIRAIPQDMCVRVVQNFKRRIQTCIDENGSHIEHLD